MRDSAPMMKGMDEQQVLGGRYAVRETLGTGATATVHLAEDLHLGRIVAVKVFGADSEVSDMQRRRHEARVLATIRHPALVTIFDAHLDAEPPFLVLEYVPGPTLAEVLAAGPLPPERVRLLGAATAAGLARAHDAGIVHRDVKPANVVIPDDRRDGAGRLVDFGIAHSPDDPARAEPGTVFGSASYLSPEQALGEEVTGASDVYSLGLVLIEAMTGTPAFRGSTPADVAARLFDAPALDHPALAEDAGLLARMTAREPEDRPTAAEVAQHLGARRPQRIEPVASASPDGEPTAAYAPVSRSA